ncbi:pulmonary surfactant-associated protein C-like isoform X2 [Pseudophryne corroboree]|uniref:pulmonary surfactant-associated protein C-like isoform X2 n=1 Tax=Pseudophryne corroboree TaxID=495146 RepID=UPI00308126D8
MQVKSLISFPKMNERGKTWMWSIVVLMLLAVIVVGATLVGVYMTQKHTEAVVEMAFNSKNGEKVQQTVMVSNGENVAAFYVNTNNTSSTVLYDYKHDIIGFRRMGNNRCYIMDMTTSDVPTMSDILKSVRNFQKQNVTSDTDISYNLLEGEEADRTKLGVHVNILCRDVPIYWATQNKSPRLRWKFTIKFEVFGMNVSFSFQS